MPSPPNLKPFLSPLPEVPPVVNVPLLCEIQFSSVTGPIGPVSVFVNRSHPSSILLCAIQRRKIFPVPVVSLQANPSAFSLVTSLLSYDSQSTMRLFDGHSSTVAVEE